jgi:hypothetical protein
LRYFEEAGFDRLFKVPLLVIGGASKSRPITFRELSLDRIRGLCITNSSDRQIPIVGTSKLTAVGTVPELFERFIRVSHHLTRFGHFRDLPEYYVPVLAGNRYFLFHGDGFCCQLAVLFQALSQEALGEKVTAHYCRNSDFSFSHGYCRWWSGDTEMYVDPDLKAIFPASQISSFYPKTWYINFFENLAIRLYHEVDEGLRQHLFYDFNRRYWDWLLSACTRELSEGNSRYEITRNLYLASISSASELYDVMADDYGWKQTYRRYVQEYRRKKNLPCEGSQFLFDTQESLRIWVPPKGQFRVEGPASELPAELILLMKLFFGRVVGSIGAQVVPGRATEIRCPELPWFVSIQGSLDYIVINGIKLAVHPVPGRHAGWLGMGDLQALLPGLFNHNHPLLIEGEGDVDVRVYFPVNATFWNSGYLELSAREESELAVQCSYAE